MTRAQHDAEIVSPGTDVTRQRVEVTGVVQGVGFRPFVYRLARQHGLTGSVQNDSEGVRMEIEGRSAAINVFMADLNTRLPTGAERQSILVNTVPCLGSHTF